MLPACPRRSFPRPRRRKRQRRAACCHRGTTGREAGDLRLRARDHRPVEPELCLPGGPHRGVRPGRHALGRASDVHAGGLLPGARSGGGGEEAGAEERRAVQDRAVGQPGGDRQALDAGPREDPRCDADVACRWRSSTPKRRNGSRRPSIRAGTAPTPSSSISRCSKCCATCATTPTRPTS